MMSLDQLISQQFGKVTKLANNKFGWNKYDLAILSAQISTISIAGSGIYEIIMNTLASPENPPSRTFANGIAGLAVGIAGTVYLPLYLRNLERKESDQIIKSGATPLSRYSFLKPFRPIALGTFGLGTFVGLANLLTGNYTEHSPIQKAWDLWDISVGSEVIFGIFASYFLSQPMAPPMKKKNPLKALYQKLTRTLPPYTEPTTIPVSK